MSSSQHLRVDVDAEQEVIAAQRAVIIEMRERGEIDNVVLRELQAELDLQASRRYSSV
jgi:hypothetical protein